MTGVVEGLAHCGVKSVGVGYVEDRFIGGEGDSVGDLKRVVKDGKISRSNVERVKILSNLRWFRECSEDLKSAFIVSKVIVHKHKMGQ